MVKTVLGKGGRVVIPAPYRKTLGIKEGDPVFVHLEGKEIRILTPRETVERAQARVSRYVSKKRSLAREVLRERRKEARRE